MKKIFNLSLLTLGLVLPAAVSAYGSLSSSTFDGGGGDWDSGESAALDAATGGVYVAGTASSPVSGQNLWVGRYDANAVLVSSFSLNGAANSQDWGRAIAVDSGGNVWAAGYTKNPDQDITLVKLTPSLVFLASATFNGSASETASGIAMDSDNNAYVVGYSSAGTQDLNAVILKYDSSAHFVSSVSVNGSAATGDQAHGIYIDAGNNLWVTGLLNEAAGGYNAWAGKFDTNLNLLDSGTFDGAAGGYDEFKAAAPAAGGGLWSPGPRGITTSGSPGSTPPLTWFQALRSVGRGPAGRPIPAAKWRFPRTGMSGWPAISRPPIITTTPCSCSTRLR